MNIIWYATLLQAYTGQELKNEFIQVGCCEQHSNYNPCAKLFVRNGPPSGFTCSEAKGLYCDSRKNANSVWDGCESCYGIHTGECTMTHDQIRRKAQRLTSLPESLGNGIVQPLGRAPLPQGFSEVELLIQGEATSYLPRTEPKTDGKWRFKEYLLDGYKIRVIIRYPTSGNSGIIIVEWLNVTAGKDNSVDWTYLAEEIGRKGHIYVGISAQYVGIMGRDSGTVDSLIDVRGLGVQNPARYGNLSHPGDEFSFDIFTQSTLAAVDYLNANNVHGKKIIAIGNSQSAGFLTTYINAVHPLVGIFDGYLVHSRGSGSPVPGNIESLQSSGEMGLRMDGVMLRDDINVPVFIYETETDLNILNYARARQENTKNICTWEVAGTSHADTYSLTMPNGLSRDSSFGNLIGCGSINDGPQHETLQSALYHLIRWIEAGTYPPISPRIEVRSVDKQSIGITSVEFEIIRDELGFAIGGIRTPTVIAPLRILDGDPGSSQGFCFLFGKTTPINATVLHEMYPSLEFYVHELQVATAQSVESGWLLQTDADIMIEEETARAQLLGLL